MPSISKICQTWQSGVSSEQKSKALQATIGLCESTVADGEPIADGGAGTYFSCQQNHVGQSGRQKYPYIQPRVPRHHSLYPYPDAFNHGQ